MHGDEVGTKIKHLKCKYCATMKLIFIIFNLFFLKKKKNHGNRFSFKIKVGRENLLHFLCDLVTNYGKDTGVTWLIENTVLTRHFF